MGCDDAHPGQSHDDFMKSEDEEDEEEHGPSPHIPGKPVGKVGGHQPSNAYDSPEDNPEEEGEEEDETRGRRLQRQLEGQRYEALSLKQSPATSVYHKEASKILRQTRRGVKMKR